MASGKDRLSRLKLEDDLEEMDLKNDHPSATEKERDRMNGTRGEVTIKAESPRSISSKSTQHSQRSPSGPRKISESPYDSDMSKSEQEKVIGGEVTVKIEPGKPPKLARSSSQKIWTRPAPLFDEYPSRTQEAQTKFEVIQACIYGSKYMGSTEHGMDCDCAEEWGKLILN